jgi:DNA-binding response OmpR family regulator
MSRILVVEDEQHLADGLRYNLEAEQYDVDIVESGEEALERLTTETGQHDLVILDVMLPGTTDHVASRLRDARRFVPVLMRQEAGRTSAASAPAPTTTCPSLAADPSVACADPAAPRVFAEAALPAPAIVASQFSFGDKSIDFEQLEVRVGDKRMPLTLMEAALLRYFVQHDGSPVPRKEIPRRCGACEDTDTRDRQLHRPAAPLYRGGAVQPAPSADSPGRRLPFRVEARVA